MSVLTLVVCHGVLSDAPHAEARRAYAVGCLVSALVFASVAAVNDVISH